MERPDGSTATLFGGLLIAIGLFAIFFGVNAETSDGLIWSAVAANLGIGLGIILLSLGYLVKAIWFLPGRDDEILHISKSNRLFNERPYSSAASEDCEWCGRTVYGPTIPCSMTSDADLSLHGPNVSDDRCRSELLERDYV